MTTPDNMRRIIPITEAEARLPFSELNGLLNEKCERIRLQSAPWNENLPVLPMVNVRIAHSPSHIILKFDVAECEFRIAETEQPASVWEDSCVEFFVEPEKGGGYYNFEFNAAGVLHLAYGAGRHGREMAPDGIRQSVVREVSMFATPNKDNPYVYNWTLIARIPYATFFRHHFEPRSGQVIRGNFYKCGDKLRHPCYLYWSPIDTPSPDFHQPSYFDNLEFAQHHPV